MTSSTEMRQPGFWYGVRSFWLPLTLFAAFSLALIGIVITASFVELNSTRRDAEENLRVIGKVKAEAIADWLDERRNDS